MLSFLKKTPSDMILLVGLGNPGSKYSGNRHNIGFMTIDEIAEGYGFPPFKSKFQGQISQGEVHGQKVLLLKPETYMNNSGQAVSKAAKFYKIPSAHIFVFHDELDLKPFEIKVKTGGGNAGHNGLKSIQAHLGTPDFVRIRMGIGHPGEKSLVTNYVLGDFSKAEENKVKSMIENSITTLKSLFQN